MGGIWRVNRRGVDVPGQSAQAQKAAQLALARDERRRQAECDAQRLVTEARSLDSEAVIPHTLRLLSRSLKVHHVTLTIGPETRPKAIFYANPAGATTISGSDFGGETEPPLLPPTDGAISRLHAFAYSTNQPEPLGCLTLHSMEPRSFRAAEVALVDALAEILALELERPAGISGVPEAGLKHAAV